jgi:hypothetical protein
MMATGPRLVESGLEVAPQEAQVRTEEANVWTSYSQTTDEHLPEVRYGDPGKEVVAVAYSSKSQLDATGAGGRKSPWLTRKRILILGASLLVVAVGLGVGIGIGLRDKSRSAG